MYDDAGLCVCMLLLLLRGGDACMYDDAGLRTYVPRLPHAHLPLLPLFTSFLYFLPLLPLFTYILDFLP